MAWACEITWTTDAAECLEFWIDSPLTMNYPTRWVTRFCLEFLTLSRLDGVLITGRWP
jgi:hypothetical protein